MKQHATETFSATATDRTSLMLMGSAMPPRDPDEDDGDEEDEEGEEEEGADEPAVVREPDED
jgi:hypothetical protein